MAAPTYPFQNWVHWTPPVLAGATVYFFARGYKTPGVSLVIALAATILTEKSRALWTPAPLPAPSNGTS